MTHHTQVHYLVERNDPVTGPDGWYLNLIRDSDGCEGLSNKTIEGILEK